MDTLTPGTVLPNGATVIACRYSSTGRPLVLADNGREYVTWKMWFADGVNLLQTAMGHYFPYDDFFGAVTDFRTR